MSQRKPDVWGYQRHNEGRLHHPHHATNAVEIDFSSLPKGHVLQPGQGLDNPISAYPDLAAIGCYDTHSFFGSMNGVTTLTVTSSGKAPPEARNEVLFWFRTDLHNIKLSVYSMYQKITQARIRAYTANDQEFVAEATIIPGHQIIDPRALIGNGAPKFVQVGIGYPDDRPGFLGVQKLIIED